MSRQTHSKQNVTTIAFLLLIVSIGFPFQNIPIIGDIELQSDYAIVNFFLGKGFEGATIFNPINSQVAFASSHPEGYVEAGFNSSDPTLFPVLYIEQPVIIHNETESTSTYEPITYYSEPLPPVQAENVTYPIITRGETFNTIQLDKYNFTTKLGLPEYIERFDGVFIPHEYWEDGNHVTFNSATLSFVFDKNACAYTIYSDGRIYNNSTEIIKSDTWVVKFAENGTDNWADVPQQSLGCVTEVFDLPDDVFQIKYTKSDSLGSIDHVMNMSRQGGMKHIVSYTNDNPAWNNTKIGFSHILSGTPDHIGIMENNGNATSGEIKYAKFSTSGDIPVSMAGNSTMVDDQNPLDIPFTDLIVNGTMLDEGFSFHFADSNKKQIHYDFDQGLEKLWNISFEEVINGNTTSTDVYLDYMNDPAILPVGETVTIDPLINLGNPLVNRVLISGSSANTGGLGCANNGLGCVATGVDTSSTYSWSTSTQNIPFWTFDISAVPTNADIQNFTMVLPSNSIFESISRASSGVKIYTMNGEDFGSLTPQELTDCIYINNGGTASWAEVNPADGEIPVNPNDNLGGEGLEGHDNRIEGGSTTTNPCGASHVDPRNSPTPPDNDAGFTINSGADFIYQDATGDMPNDLESRFLQLGLSKYTFIWCDTTRDQTHGTSGSTSGYRNHGNAMCQANLLASGSTPAQGALDSSPFRVLISASKSISMSSSSFLELTYVVLTQASAPLVLTCTPTTPTSVDLDWFPPADLGGAAFVDGYRIERDSGGGFTNLVEDSGSAITFHTDNTVSAGTLFKYRVAAITGFGLGVYSSEVSCGVASESDEVTNLTATNQAIEVVALDWTEPPFTGNTPIIGYQIDRTIGTGAILAIPDLEEWYWRAINEHPAQGCTGVGVGQDTNNIQFSTGTGNSRCNIFLFKTFDATLLQDRDLFIDKTGFTVSPAHAHTFILDGAYDVSDASDFAQGLFPNPFPASVLNTGGAGNGILYGAGSSITTGDSMSTPTIPKMNFNVSCLGDTLPCNAESTSPDGKVTVFFYFSEIECCSGSSARTYSVDDISIEGFQTWDFGTIAPASFILQTVDFSCHATCGTSTANFILGDGFVTIVTDTGNTNVEYLDTTVAQLTDYGYRVFALNSEGSSSSSNIAVIFTAGLPEVPDTPTVTPTGTQTINIDWEDAELNGGTLVTYEVERKIGLGGIFSTLTSVTETTHDDGLGIFPLSPATEYCYRINVETNIGTSAFSGEACATTFDAPAEVENLTVTALDGSSVDMSFETPLSDGGSPIIGYKVERQIGGGSFVTLDALTFVQTRNDTGLPIGTLIEYRVSASNQFGFGNPVTVGDTTDATPQVPQNFVCSSATPDSINLSWETPETFSPPTGYRLDRNLDGGVFTTLVGDTASTATTFVDPSLDTDTIYGYRILAHTAEGDTLFTPDVFCKTLGIPDSPLSNFQAEFTLLTPHTVTLTWDIPELFGIPIISIVIERDDGAGFVTLATLPSNAVGMIDDDLNNNVSQKYRIKMVGSVGDSVNSVAIPTTTNQISHWHYEKTIDDTGANKNTGTLTGLANFNNTLHNGLGFTLNGVTYITVADESDYDFDNDSFGITTYYQGNSTGSTQMLVSKASSFTATGFKFFIDSTGVPAIKLTTTSGSNEIHILGSTNVTDGNSHFLGIGYNGNQTALGVSLMVDGVFESKNVITDNLVGSILNNEALVIGATSSGSDIITAILDETRFFGSGTLDDDQMEDIFNEEVESIAPINATMSLTGSTFADISNESPTITLISGFPLPSVTGVVELKNFTATTVNTITAGTIPASGILSIQAMFNQMGSLSNYTALATLDNGLEVFVVFSSFNLQTPQFTLPEGIDFFFQQSRDPTFQILSFNFTRTSIPFDLSCNLKSELFANGTTFTFLSVGFLQELFPVNPLKDVVVACIDPNSPLLNPDEPSFGGSNALLTFVSFGDTSGIGAFLNFTDNYGDFFGAPLPFLFVILAAALFTGRSAPTGIIIVGIAIGIMWAMEILTIDPIMWGIIVVLVILGAIGGKKFL